MIKQKGNILYLTSNILSKFKDKLFHLYTTRFYGYSKGGYFSLNLGKEEDYYLDLNRKMFKKTFFIDIKEHFNLEHKDKIFLIDNLDKEYIGDAFLTFSNNVPIYMYFADCLPIYLYLPNFNLIGLIHGGWRGTLLNIAGKTIRFIKTKLKIKDFYNLYIWIGPGICKNCFEVSKEVFDKFLFFYKDSFSLDFLYIKGNKYFIDLKKLTLYQLLKEGIRIENIEISQLCTKSSNFLFFSYRRQGKISGRQIGLIMQKGG